MFPVRRQSGSSARDDVTGHARRSPTGATLCGGGLFIGSLISTPAGGRHPPKHVGEIILSPASVDGPFLSFSFYTR